MSTVEEEASISIPSVIFVTVLGFILYRYFFASPTTQSTSTTSTSRNGPRFTAAQVDQVAAMFPQLNRRDIMWDLHRNRGSVQATTDRILTGGRLETAPPSFQPILPTSPQSTTTSSSPLAASGMSIKSNIEPDLITRYNLQGKVEQSEKGKGKEKEEPNYGWASNKDERQAMLQRRRDEMILAARRKMMEKDAAKSGFGGETSSVEPVLGTGTGL